ncbi:hypothetical protein HMPREF0972_02562 [Actinomyces sp. oral taxon 848 str. F0332]|nr:hypothetical protein HMPREF0972_02562 [Actinomyces sp. oral taxon 848 str. F0332]
MPRTATSSEFDRSARRRSTPRTHGPNAHGQSAKHTHANNPQTEKKRP